MESICPEVNALHTAYCEALGFPMSLFPPWERQWLAASNYGLTPEMLKSVIKSRQGRIKAGVRHPECLMFRNIAGSEEAIADVIQEGAALAAQARVKVMNPARAAVLRSTGRSDEVPQGPVRPIGEVIASMRLAAGA